MKKVVFVLFLFLFSCASKNTYFSFPKEEKVVLAVAPCFHPRYGWDMLAGYIESDKNINTNVLKELDLLIFQTLEKRKVKFIRAEITKQCIELIKFSKKKSIFQYWIKVGQCVPTDFLLIPYIYKYQKREGGEYGVKRPAHVVFDLFLFDIKKKKLVYRFHFDEAQVSLSENLLSLGKFFARKGKWITAKELFLEGLKVGLGEIGL
ncbi:hypothetical protein SAMN04488516_101323 [Desulfonauticus submarinus]|uniref:Lipoprotein n=1 Tax=Desulfonauticus submarinus TaxID=206665 RepID=A0A1H0A8R3_9BACT|nr:hypothetical protein [Desulfonauticus submarinus]SDN29910.1 hypothetical protein SAMN04488516_101323 [Desulfonauticus submarinus]